MRIHTNTASMYAQRFASNHNDRVSDISGKLASGDRITKASDDAAVLSISSKLQARTRGTVQANRNANDGISIVQVAQGSLQSMQGMIVRIKELAIQSASDTYDDNQREMLNIEAQELKSELDRIANSSAIHDIKLLNGNQKMISVGVGVDASENSSITLDLSDLSNTVKSLGLHNVQISSKEGARSTIGTIEGAQNRVGMALAKLGGYQQRLQSSSNNLENSSISEKRSLSVMRDADYAQLTAENVSEKLKLDAATATVASANLSGANVLKLMN
jgi:flagellin